MASIATAYCGRLTAVRGGVLVPQRGPDCKVEPETWNSVAVPFFSLQIASVWYSIALSACVGRGI